MSRLDPVEDLLRAFAARDLDAIRGLAAAGLDLDAAGGGGLTTLMRAVLRRDAVAVEWILAAGADPGARTADGKTALDFARELDLYVTPEGDRRNELIELLVVAGAAAEAPADASTEGVEAPPQLEIALPETMPAPERPPVARRLVTRPPEPARCLDATSDTFADQIDDRFDDPQRQR